MPEVACKIVDCCDLDDFPQSSSAEGNCPTGWQWDGTSCVRCAIPIAPSIALTGGSGVVDISFNVAADLAYIVERFSDGHWMTLSSGTGGGSVESYADDTVTPGQPYSYRITVAVSEECGYIQGESASVVAI